MCVCVGISDSTEAVRWKCLVTFKLCSVVLSWLNLLIFTCISNPCICCCMQQIHIERQKKKKRKTCFCKPFFTFLNVERVNEYLDMFMKDTCAIKENYSNNDRLRFDFIIWRLQERSLYLGWNALWICWLCILFLI